MPPKQKVNEVDEFPTQRGCATDEVHERLLRTMPGYAESRSAIEDRTSRMLAFGDAALRTGCTEIPVVVHVLFRNATENISDAQVQSQIAILNQDFRATNPDRMSTPAVFQPLIGDARVTFKLATTDPAGNPTDGITRTSTTNTSFSSATDNAKHAATGGEDAWPADRYLNLWTCGNLRSGSGQALLGYAQFPGGPADTDGVVILHSAFGNTGTAAAPFNLGRTATHEIGHWLNLRHIWGDDGTGCAGSDFVADTPNAGGPNFGAPAFPHVSCSNGPNGDLFMNYMDYTDDVAMFMFTQGQVARMQAALDGPRSSIGTTGPCDKTVIKDAGKEVVKDTPKDPIKDVVKESPKDHVKEPVKEAIKERPKDPFKEIVKETPKDHVKEFPKDPPKEFVKDLPKDPPKEIIKEHFKDFSGDVPKELRDPVKTLTAEFPGPDPGPIFPVLPQFTQPMGVVQPFVLGGRKDPCEGCGGGAAAQPAADPTLALILQQLAEINAALMRLLQR